MSKNNEGQGRVPTAKDPLIAGWRSRYYDPEVAAGDRGGRDATMDALVDLARGLIRGWEYSTDGVVREQTFRRTFEEPVVPDGSAAFLTEVAVSEAVDAHPSADVLRSLEATLVTRDQAGFTLRTRIVRLETYADEVGIVSMTDLLDGVAAALEHDDPSFERGAPVTEGTEFDTLEIFNTAANLANMRPVQPMPQFDL